MATPIISDGIVQIVGEQKDDKGRTFNTEGLKGLIDACCKDREAHYPIYSIIGAQGSGKSTLMNTMFNTNFQTLVQETKDGRKATTKGIWAAICNTPKAIVLDVEGSDGEENQDDPRFQNQSALFALMISDVLIFNIDLRDIGRNHGASLPILRTIFEECLRQEKVHKTKLVFTVRDYNGKTPVPVLLKQLLSTLDTIWNKLLDRGEVQTLTQYFGKPSMEAFPNYDYKKDEFQKKCKAIVDKWSTEFSYEGPDIIKVGHFRNMATQLWDMIRQNKRLDIPTHQAMKSLSSCEQIKLGILEYLEKSNEDFRLLSKGEPENPSGFHQRLVQVMDKVSSRYDDETKYYETSIAESVKKELTEKIMHKVEQSFKGIMSKFMLKLCVEAATKITKDCQKTILHKSDCVNSVVNDYISKFTSETKDIDLYSVQIEKHKEVFERDIKFIGSQLLEVAKRQTCWDAAEVLSIGLATTLASGAVGVVVGATGGSITLIPGVCGALSTMAVEGIDNTLNESGDKLNNFKNKVLSKYFGDRTDIKGTYSGGSSSSSK